MNIVLLGLFLELFVNPYSNQEIKGMDYSIYADRETGCVDYFPDDLSFFFEQWGGYQEDSEVGQVSLILKIDLSCFQHYGYITSDPQEERGFWQDINQFEGKVNEFLTKIHQNPEYYKLVKHGKDTRKAYEELMEAHRTGNAAKVQELTRSDIHYYPPDRGYLRSGQLVKDLTKLKAILTCYKKAGVKKIKLMYS